VHARYIVRASIKDLQSFRVSSIYVLVDDCEERERRGEGWRTQKDPRVDASTRETDVRPSSVRFNDRFNERDLVFREKSTRLSDNAISSNSSISEYPNNMFTCSSVFTKKRKSSVFARARASDAALTSRRGSFHDNIS